MGRTLREGLEKVKTKDLGGGRGKWNAREQRGVQLGEEGRSSVSWLGGRATRAQSLESNGDMLPLDEHIDDAELHLEGRRDDGLGDGFDNRSASFPVVYDLLNGLERSVGYFRKYDDVDRRKCRAVVLREGERESMKWRRARLGE